MAVFSNDIRKKLTIMNFMEFGVWGAYLISMGSFLVGAGLGRYISYFFALNGIVCLFMPALMGFVADRWIQSQRLLSICHAISGSAMIAVFVYCSSVEQIDFLTIYSLYALGTLFFLPTIALSNSTAFYLLEKDGFDTVRHYPGIRTFGTIGFIASMLFVDWNGLQQSAAQFAFSGCLSLLLSAYVLTLPQCPCIARKGNSVVEALGLQAFTLFKNKTIATLFIFCILMGGVLQITNAYANPYISSFAALPEFKESFGVLHANTLISLSQISETLFILLIPFFMNRFNFKAIVLTSMIAWMLRFGFFALGNPGSGLWLLILSMIVYGVAFDFFNISTSLFINMHAPAELRSSAQGIMMLMTNGIGATFGMIAAGNIINTYTHSEIIDGTSYTLGDWTTCWYIFAAYCLFLAITFTIFFKTTSPTSPKDTHHHP